MKSKKLTVKKKQTRITKPADASAVVYIVGEAPMVEEYALLCSGRGYRVLFHCPQMNSGKMPFESKAIQRQSRPPVNTSFALELTNVDLEQKRRNLELLDKVLPATTAIVSSSVTVSATEQASWIKHTYRLVGCGALPTLSGAPLIEIAPTVFSPAETVRIVQTFFRSVGKEIELVQDRIGLVFPRILCQMVNEAAFALQEEIASPQDLDTAMTIGARFPAGPIAWAEKVGLRQVQAVLQALWKDLGDERMRGAPLLRQMALSSSWWKHSQPSSEERHSR